MQYINDFKWIAIRAGHEREGKRVCLPSEQLKQFWQGLTLGEMAQIYTLKNDYIINFLISQLLEPYLKTRKVVYQAYMVTRADNGEQTALMYFYDCKIFRSGIYSKEENQFISSFILCFKQPGSINEPLFQMVQPNLLQSQRWVLAVKQSALLRVFNYVSDTVSRIRDSSDKLVLEQSRYLDLMQEWIKCYYNYNTEIMVSHFFKGILVLIENQVLLKYLNTLTADQIRQKMFQRPIKTIEKPKNVEQFTTTQTHFGEISWNSLKITAYQLKYLIKQTEDCFECYQIQEKDQGGVNFEELQIQDQLLVAAFQQYRSFEDEYNQNY